MAAWKDDLARSASREPASAAGLAGAALPDVGFAGALWAQAFDVGSKTRDAVAKESQRGTKLCFKFIILEDSMPFGPGAVSDLVPECRRTPRAGGRACLPSLKTILPVIGRSCA